MTVRIFALMGALTAIAAAISTARLNAATNAQGTLDELYTIAAAVIGDVACRWHGNDRRCGTRRHRHAIAAIGHGALRVDTPLQSIVIGVVLVMAVWLDTVYRGRAK